MPKLLKLCDCGTNDDKKKSKKKRVKFNTNAKTKDNYDSINKSNSLLMRLFDRISKSSFFLL